VATALVEDEATGDEVVLTDRGPCLAGSPLGLFASRTTPGFRRELKEGESVALNGASYCATHIDLQPPQVVIARILPGATEPRLITLMPARAPAAGEQMSPPTASEGTTQTPPRRP
jgi:hypothetical protein